ncbi:MAG: hypothetical protein HOO92_16010 [Methylococcaceae bacterium]|nr:hypothetical protein [Methylococcaceae bacterium]
MSMAMKSLVLGSLMLLLSACVYYPHGGRGSYGGGSYYGGGHGGYHENNFHGGRRHGHGGGNR